MRRIATAILGIGIIFGVERNAHAKDALRVAVATTLHREAIGVRLGAEIAELGYVAVPISSDDTHDGAVLASSLQKNDAVAALVLDQEGEELIACVVERANMRRTCRQVASRGEPLDDGSIATRSVELLRALLVENTDESPPTAPTPIEPKTSTLAIPPERPTASLPPPQIRRSVVVARLGGGVFATSGAPAEVIADAGLEWLALPHGALSLDATLPIAGTSITRDAGAATIRVSTLTLHADARAHVKRFEGEIGAGVGALWLQANGITSSASVEGAPPNQGVDSSLLAPFVALHAAGVFFLDRAISLRLDVTGAYGFDRAVIRFDSQDVGEVGRPMLMSTLSLAIAWP